jgi:FtsP/CotA-like multicopper oxidase with cupredoxin domain
VLTSRWHRIALGTTLAAAAIGYAGLPQAAVNAAPSGMTLGHVPTAPAPMSATVVIPKNAATKGYSTKVVTISAGATLSVVNLDSIEHTVTSDAKDAKGNPLFNQYSPPGSTTSIPAASKLAPGTYDFHCLFHPQVMTGTLIVDGSGGGTHPVTQRFTQPLKIPRVLTGSNLTIPVKRAKVRVLPTGPKTWMWTYGGTYPGPTIRRPAGKDTKVTFINRLPKAAGAITVHLHGDHHSSASDGQPDSYLIRHGHRRTYNYPLTDGGKPETEAFDFYHDHRMNETGRNNWHGLQGMFIVDNPVERQFKLPKGKYDVPLLVSDRSFTKHNQLTNPFRGDTMTTRKKGAHAPPGDATVGDHILVNGRFAPYLKVAAHRYRLRLLNASNFSSYDFALSDGRPFVQIGTGDDLLPKPVVRQDILLGPSQRADVIVDFHSEVHQKVLLESVPRTKRPPQGIGTPTASIMQFRVTHKAKDRTRLPSKLLRPPHITAPKHVSMKWTFALGGTAKTGTYWTVNGKPFDPHRVDVEVPLGSTETWLLKNMSPITHFIHLHEEQWHTISRDGKRPPPWERGLEDTWRLDPGETVKVAAHFTDYTGVFMLHCHMLNHEDDGMMAQFAVVSRHHHKLPKGYYLASAQPPASSSASSTSMPGMNMSGMTMSAADMASMPMAGASGDQPTSSSRVTRALRRAGIAVLLELAALGLLGLLVVAARWQRRRHQAPATP